MIIIGHSLILEIFSSLRRLRPNVKVNKVFLAHESNPIIKRPLSEIAELITADMTPPIVVLLFGFEHLWGMAGKFDFILKNSDRPTGKCPVIPKAIIELCVEDYLKALQFEEYLAEIVRVAKIKFGEMFVDGNSQIQNKPIAQRTKHPDAFFDSVQLWLSRVKDTCDDILGNG